MLAKEIVVLPPGPTGAANIEALLFILQTFIMIETTCIIIILVLLMGLIPVPYLIYKTAMMLVILL
jgi:hypothetical protein